MPVARSPSVPPPWLEAHDSKAHLFPFLQPLEGETLNLFGSGTSCSFELCLLSLSSFSDIQWFTNVKIFLTLKNIPLHCLSINQLVYLIPTLHQHYIRGALLTSSTYPVTSTLSMAQSLSRVWLFRHPMDWGRPDSFVCEISQARILEWVAISSLRGSSRPRDQTRISYICHIGKQIPYLQSHLGDPLSPRTN